MEDSEGNFGALQIKLEPPDDFGSDNENDDSFDEDAERVMETLIQKIKQEHAEVEETDAESAGLGNIVAQIDGVKTEKFEESAEFDDIKILEIKAEINDDEESIKVEKREEKGKRVNFGKENGMVEEIDVVEGSDESEYVDVEMMGKGSEQGEGDIEEDEEEYEEGETYVCALCDLPEQGDLSKNHVAGDKAKSHLLEHISVQNYECLECDLSYTQECLNSKHTLIEFELIGQTLLGQLYKYVSAAQLMQKVEKSEKKDKSDVNKTDIQHKNNSEKKDTSGIGETNVQKKNNSEKKDNSGICETNVQQKNNLEKKDNSSICETGSLQKTDGSMKKENFNVSGMLQKVNSEKNESISSLQNNTLIVKEQGKIIKQFELSHKFILPRGVHVTKLQPSFVAPMPQSNGTGVGPVTYQQAVILRPGVLTFKPIEMYETKTNIPNVSKHPFICLECKEGFVSRDELEVHNALLHGHGQPTQCPHCNMSFTSKRKLSIHLKTNESTGCQVHICTVCNKIFRRREQLRTHMFIHTGKGSFECKHCKKTWKNRSILKRHLESHKTEKSYQCGVCSKFLATANSLKIHMYIHTGERSFPCPICNKVYSEKRFLRVHMCTHTGEGNFKCSICSKVFYSSSQLKLHMCKHTGERPHVCEICNQAFLVRNSLLRHMFKHNGKKPYSCLTCNKKFVLKQDLGEHVKIHTERMHKCELCHRGFTTGAYLNRHMKQHAKTSDRYQCDVCGLYYLTENTLRRHKIVHMRIKMQQRPGDKESEISNEENSKPEASNATSSGNNKKVRFYCQLCGLYYMSEYGLAQHVKVHDNSEVTNAGCHDNDIDMAVDTENDVEKHDSDKGNVKCVDRMMKSTGRHAYDNGIENANCHSNEMKNTEINDEEVPYMENIVIKQETEDPNVFVTVS